MSAAAPLPKKKQVEMDEKIDDAIAKIDAALPVIHQKVAQARESGRAPSPSPATSGFSVKNFMRTQQRLQTLAREMQESTAEEEELTIEEVSLVRIQKKRKKRAQIQNRPQRAS